jgi:hypothetical protein
MFVRLSQWKSILQERNKPWVVWKLFNLCVNAGEYCWKLIPDGIASGYPRLISDQWPGVPSDIDAATATESGLTYFFKGDRYWAYDHSCESVRESYISVGWPGIPANVDGASWGGHSIFYFFKGELCVI